MLLICLPLTLLLINKCFASSDKVFITTESPNFYEKIPQALINLNSCFRYVPDVRLKLAAEHIGGTESIQFKDECLKACLKSQVQQVFTCRSLMHIPTDDDCLLTTTDMNHTEYERIKDFPTTNYYENLCALNPYESDGGVYIEARFNSYKGGEGILKFAQKYNNPTKALLILEGIQESTKIQIRHYQENVEDCYKMRKEDVAKAKPLFESISDPTGMAISPWSTVDLESNHANTLETLILIVMDDHTVINCGRIKPALNSHDAAALKSSGSFSTLSVHLLSFIVVFALFC